MIRFLIDTAVFVYALGGEHRYREPCRRVVALAGEGKLRAEASADLVQELMHQRFRRTGDRALAARQAREVAALCSLHEVRPEDVRAAIGLFARSQRLHARDAIFASVALNRGLELILSPDQDFDEVDGLQRVDPADGSEVDRLART